MSPWTDAKLAELKRLCEAGMSPVKVAKALGVSRNAATGQAARHGWAFKSSMTPRRQPITLRRLSFEGE